MDNEKSTPRVIPVDHSLTDFQDRAARHHSTGSRRPRLRALVQTGRRSWLHLPPRYLLHMLIALFVPLALLVGRYQPRPQQAAVGGEDQEIARATDAGIQRPFDARTFVEPESAEVIAISSDLTIPSWEQPVSSRSEERQVAFPIAGDKANLRNGPGTVFDKVAVLELGAMVTVTARYENWLNIQSAADSAWISADLVDIPAETLEEFPIAESIPEPPPPLIASTTVDDLNLRDGPGRDYVGMTKLPEGTAMDLLARHGDWFRVQTSEGAIGWVTAEYLALRPGVVERVPVTDEIPSANPNLVGWVAENSVNLRSGPNTKFESLGKMASDTELTLLARYDTWYKVETPRCTKGWVAADLLSVSAFIKRRVPVTDDIPALPKPKPAAAAQPAAQKTSSGGGGGGGGGGWVWPSWGDLTSTFGWRSFGGGTYHNGIDLANRTGTSIVAAHGGSVIKAGWCGGYGYCVFLSHDGGLTTEYGHMMSYPVVSVGQYVSAGQLIGYMGSTYGAGGYSSGTHLHFTVKSWGTAVNPLRYLP